MKKLLFALTFTLLMVGTNQKAEAAHGQITDLTPSQKIVGVWVEVQGGRSGWAELGHNTRQQTWWRFDTQDKPWLVQDW